MSYVRSSTSLGLPAIESHGPAGYVGEWHPGFTTTAVDPTYGTGEFIYLAGAANTVLGSVVTYDAGSGATTLAAANAVGPVAVAMAPTVASEFGWYQIRGRAVAKVLTGFASGAACYLTSTAGSIDDAVVAGDYIRGMVSASAVGTPSSGLAEIDLNYPNVSNGLDV